MTATCLEKSGPGYHCVRSAGESSGPREDTRDGRRDAIAPAVAYMVLSENWIFLIIFKLVVDPSSFLFLMSPPRNLVPLAGIFSQHSPRCLAHISAVFEKWAVPRVVPHPPPSAVLPAARKR